MLVSHDRDFLDGCIDHVLALNREGMDLQKGNYSSWFENKERQDAFEAATNEKLKKSVEKLERSARQAAGWAEQTEKTKKGTKNSGLRSDRGYIGHQAAKMMSRFIPKLCWRSVIVRYHLTEGKSWIRFLSRFIRERGLPFAEKTDAESLLC